MTDTKVKSESAETQKASPAKKQTPAEGPEKVDSKVVKKPDPEVEKIWGELSGSTQDRIVQLVKKKKELEAELERARQQPPGDIRTETKPIGSPSKEEIKEAVKQLIQPLKDSGVVTKEDLRMLQDRMYLEREHDRLKSKYDGSDGTPKYIPDEVEDYARTKYFGGNLEAAYKDMYHDELVDAEVRARTVKKKTYTEKPKASVKLGEKTFTLASFRERLKQPDGPVWWEKNREKLEPLLKKLSKG